MRFVVRRARSSVSVFPQSVVIENVGHGSWLDENSLCCERRRAFPRPLAPLPDEGYLEKLLLREAELCDRLTQHSYSKMATYQGCFVKKAGSLVSASQFPPNVHRACRRRSMAIEQRNVPSGYRSGYASLFTA